MRGTPLVLFAAAVCAAAAASSANALPERPTVGPDPALGRVPAARSTGPAVVVCKPDSRSRILRLPSAARRRSLALLPLCRFQHVQAAVTAAAPGTRVLVLPGVYREEPSRAASADDPRCAHLLTASSDGTAHVPSYAYQAQCPNAQNLIAIVGKENIQIAGTGAAPADVLFVGDGAKANVVRADRANGVVLRNFAVEHAAANNVYVLETNGFRVERVVSRWSREHGVASLAADNGLYTDVTAYGSGGAGIAPAAGPQGACRRYGIELRRANAFNNTVGLAGTSGDGLWIHDGRFHHNATGLAFDSLSRAVAGAPQDCARVERNRVFSNNLDVFSAQRDTYCTRPPSERNSKVVCPTVLRPLGTGIVFAGGNGNVVLDNWIYDNWRYGAMLLRAPAALRGAADPALQHDTSHGNRFAANRMGLAPGNRRAPNGVDFWWDEQGSANCWEQNGVVRSDPAQLPACASPPAPTAPNPAKSAQVVACAAWSPLTNPNPRGCPWHVRPQRPRGP